MILNLKRTQLRNAQPWVFLIISIAVISIYVVYFNVFKVNYPQHEDSHMAYFVTNWDSSSWAKRIDDWGGFTFGHRYYYPRAISLISAKLNNGVLDLTTSGAGGIVMYILFAFVFLWVFLKSKIRSIFLLPAIFLLFNPISRDYLFWALTNQLYSPALLFALLAIILVLKDGKFRFALAIASSLIAIGSFSSGLLGLPAVALVLFLRRKYAYLAVWLIATVVIFALYFRNYNTPGWGLPYISPGDPKFTILDKLFYFLACTGSTIVFEPGETNTATILSPRFWPAIIFGALCWGVLAYGVAVSWIGSYVASALSKGRTSTLAEIIRRQYDWFEARPIIRLFFTATTCLLLTTLYLVVIGRTTTENGYQIFETRLKLYPVFTEILAYCLAICLVQGRKTKLAVFSLSLLLSIGIWSYSYFHLVHRTSVDSQKLKTLIYNYKTNDNAYLADYGTWGGKTQQTNKSYYGPALEKGVLELDYNDYMANAVEDSTVLPPVRIISHENGDYGFLVPGKKYGFKESTSYFVILKNNENQFLVNLSLNANSIGQLIKTGNYFAGELNGGVMKLALPEGKYKVGLLKVGPQSIYSFKTKQEITFTQKEGESW
jgi:hypothetical protein